jgi:hypothetical protein
MYDGERGVCSDRMMTDSLVCLYCRGRGPMVQQCEESGPGLNYSDFSVRLVVRVMLR